MNKTIFSIVTILLLLISSFFVFPASSNLVEINNSNATLYVGGSGPGNYSSIQDAIDAASDGDTVFVYSGTYYEMLFIKKSIELIGENKISTVIDAQKEGHVIIGKESELVIKGFTIQNSHPEGSGIKLSGNSCRIFENIIYSNFYGIDCAASNSIIENNKIIENTIGVSISGSSNLIKQNDIANNSDGIYISSSGNELYKNHISANGNGINIHRGNNSISYNSISDNDKGIFLGGGGNYNNLSFNNIVNNMIFGIWTYYPSDPSSYSLYNIFYKNNFIGNGGNVYYYHNLNDYWNGNFWSNWKGFEYEDYGESLISLLNRLYERPFLSKIIDIVLELEDYPSPPYPGPFYKIPGAPTSSLNYYNIDWNPATEPYVIDTGWEL